MSESVTDPETGQPALKRVIGPIRLFFFVVGGFEAWRAAGLPVAQADAIGLPTTSASRSSGSSSVR